MSKHLIKWGDFGLANGEHEIKVVARNAANPDGVESNSSILNVSLQEYSFDLYDDVNDKTITLLFNSGVIWSSWITSEYNTFGLWEDENGKIMGPNDASLVHDGTTVGVYGTDLVKSTKYAIVTPVFDDSQIIGRWVFNETLAFTDDFDYDWAENNSLPLDFLCNGEYYDSISVIVASNQLLYGSNNDYLSVYSDGWVKSTYRTAEISDISRLTIAQKNSVLNLLTTFAVKEEEKEEDEDELQGLWLLNSKVDGGSLTSTVVILDRIFNVNFQSNGLNYNYFECSLDPAIENYTIYYGRSDGAWTTDGPGDPILSPTNVSYRFVNITSKLAEVTDGVTLLSWLKANGKKVQPPYVVVTSNSDSFTSSEVVDIYNGDSASGTLMASEVTHWEGTITSGYITLGVSYDPSFHSISTEGEVEYLGDTIKQAESLTFVVSGNGFIDLYASCFAEGTSITLANGDTKAVEDVTYDDELLVWDFYNGEYATAKPTWIKIEQTAYEYHKIALSNGIVMRLVGKKGHRLFSMDEQKMLYSNEIVGHRVYTLDGIATVVSCETIQEKVKFYNLTTEKHLNCFADNVLTGSRLNNMYHIADMKYDSDIRLISEEEEAERWAVRERLRK